MLFLKNFFIFLILSFLAILTKTWLSSRKNDYEEKFSISRFAFLGTFQNILYRFWPKKFDCRDFERGTKNPRVKAPRSSNQLYFFVSLKSRKIYVVSRAEGKLLRLPIPGSWLATSVCWYSKADIRSSTVEQQSINFCFWVEWPMFARVGGPGEL